MSNGTTIIVTGIVLNGTFPENKIEMGEVTFANSSLEQPVSASCDVHGAYITPTKLPEGEYMVTASALGMKPETRKWTLKIPKTSKSKDIIYVNFALMAILYPLDKSENVSVATVGGRVVDLNMEGVANAKVKWSNYQAKISTYTSPLPAPIRGFFTRNFIADTYDRKIKKRGYTTRKDYNLTYERGRNNSGDIAI